MLGKSPDLDDSYRILKEIVKQKGTVIAVPFAEIIEIRKRARDNARKLDESWLSYASPCCKHHPEAHDRNGCILCVRNPCYVRYDDAWIQARPNGRKIRGYQDPRRAARRKGRNSA